MKPAPFRYFAPSTLDECLGLKKDHGDEARLLAGGQSLVPLMNFRLVTPPNLIDINGISELAYVLPGDGAGIRIGALTRQRTLERDPTLSQWSPILADAIPHIGHAQIRNRSTVGGSIAHADPAAELPAAAIALDGEVLLRSRSGDRLVSAQDFFIGFLTTALRPDEMVAELRLPPWPEGRGWSVSEVARQDAAFAMVGALAWVDRDDDGVCTDARVVLFGVGGTPLQCDEAAQAVIGTRLSESDITNAAEKATSGLDCTSDIHAAGDYRKSLARTLIGRTLGEAYQRSGQRSQDTP